jgi:uncharacterized protein with PIN domain
MPTSVRPRTRFAADAMLGSLARKLRAFGFDVAYYRSGDDAGILRVARSGGRILITSDRELAARGGSHGVQSVLISRNNDASRISELAAGCSARGIELVRGEPMCSLCGGELEHLPEGRRGAWSLRRSWRGIGTSSGATDAATCIGRGATGKS